MKIKEVTYEQLINTGNYENRKYGIKILCEENDDPEEVFEYARSQLDIFISGDFQSNE